MDGSGQDIKKELAKPANLRPAPIGPEINPDGYRYQGKDYLRRSTWYTALACAASADGKLVALVGFSRRHLNSSGVFTIDIFDPNSDHRTAGLDVDYQANNLIGVQDHLRRVSLINSRWFVIGLDFPNLQNLLLFDFKPSPLQ